MPPSLLPCPTLQHYPVHDLLLALFHVPQVLQGVHGLHVLDSLHGQLETIRPQAPCITYGAF